MKLLSLCCCVLAISMVGCVRKKPVAVRPGPAARPVPAMQQPAQFQGPVHGGKIAWTSADVPGPYIAMTFDDGPVRANTTRLLDMLRQRNIKASFFTVGQMAKNAPDLMRRMVAEGHEMANHTWTHPKMNKLSDAANRSELRRAADQIFAITGVVPHMYRPPYGAITARQKEWIMQEFGYPTILWSVDPLDWKTKNAASTRSRILAQTRPGAIILVHDLHASSVDAMPGTLDGLLAKGFRFVTVSQLMAMHNRMGDGGPAPVAVRSMNFAPGSF